MQTTLIRAASASVAVLAVAACGGNQKPAEEPSQVTTTTGSETGVAGFGGPASPGEPTGILPSGTTTTSGAPASPMEGGCPDAPLPPAARAAPDLTTCWKACDGLDASLPADSRCMSAKASCMAKCNTKF